MTSPAAMIPASSRPAAAAGPHDYSREAMEQLLTGSKLKAAPGLQHIALPHELQPEGAPGIVKVVKLPKVVREYPMPGARETHEMAVVGKNMLVVTQQSNSTLVKVQLHPHTGRPLACARFVVGDFWDGLHGLAASHVYPGHVWASLQFKSLLIRLNPGKDLATHPSVEQVIKLPSSVYGPHCVCECGSDLWTSCKDSSHVVRINHANPDDYSVYPCSRRPIFIAMHPTSMDVYASLDLSSKIWRLVVTTGESTEIDIPSTHGTTPVGLVAGSDGNVWFTLLGGSSGGTGTFARILSGDELQFFSLTTPVGVKAGLIHLAFDWEYDGVAARPAAASASTGVHHLWLLSSSLIAAADGYGIDAVFSVLIDSEQGGGRIIHQESISLPTQRCANHRIMPHRTGIFISQLSISCLAHITGAAAFKPAEVVGETTDRYNDFGLGEASSHYVFAKHRVSRAALLSPAVFSIAPMTSAPDVIDLKRSAAGRKRQRLPSSDIRDMD